MHQIFHTEGFVLGSRDFSEANKYFYIYTLDFGLVFASAQGVRKGQSKLRANLMDFSYVKLDLVLGKNIWRIVNAKQILTLKKASSDFETFIFVNNISKLIKRLCQGEEKNESLFRDLKEIYYFLDQKDLVKEDLLNFETVAVLKILHHLGYLGVDKNVSIFVTSNLDQDIIQKAKNSRRDLIEEINKSLKESHL